MRYLDMLDAHPNLLPLAARRVPTDPADGLTFLVASGLREDDAVALWQSILAFVVGFANFASGTMPSDVDHLPPTLATRMRRWDRDTARHTLHAILASYDPMPPAA